MAAYPFDGLELESFIRKFLYLTSCGYESNLHLTSSNRSISVNIQANLGSVIPHCETTQRNVKPSRARRRRRREELRSHDFTVVPLEEEALINKASNVILPETLCLSDTGQSRKPVCGLSSSLTLPPSAQSCSLEKASPGPQPHPVLAKDHNLHNDVLACTNEVPVTDGAATPTYSTFQENAISSEPTILSSLSAPDFRDELERSMDKFQASLEKNLKMKLESTLVKDLSRSLSPSQHT